MNSSSNKDIDVTGQSRLFINVVFSWTSELVFIAAGFIVPRMISDHLGKESLGIWDFSWSLIGYFALVQVGVVSSINRFIAKHRANNDINGINIAVSSVFIILLIMAGLVFLMTLSSYLIVPIIFREKFGSLINETQMVILFLGLSLCTQIIWSLFAGVLTGCHRWDLHHSVHGVCRILTVFMMVLVLSIGLTIKYLAIINLIGEIAGLFFRYILSYRVLENLKIKLNLFKYSVAKNMLFFGSKTFLPSIGHLISNQTVSILIVWYLGPAMLAVYARPLNLVRHVRTLIVRYSYTLSPIVTTMKYKNNEILMQEFILKSIKTGAFITMPIIGFMIILGGPLMHLWMGPDYRKELLILTMAIGYGFGHLQSPTLSILTGLNLHGKPGVAMFVSNLFAAFGAFISLKILNFDLTATAIAVVTPLALTQSIYITYYASKMLSIKLKEYIINMYVLPLIILTPYFLTLICVRFYFETPLTEIVGGGIIGAITLIIVYSQFVLSKKNKNDIISFFKRAVHFKR
jgi:O-antigen/teichoic acid export membrane protein